MAFLPLHHPDAIVPNNFADLAINFNTPKQEAEDLLKTGMTMTDIREYKRTLNNHGKTPLQ